MQLEGLSYYVHSKQNRLITLTLLSQEGGGHLIYKKIIIIINEPNYLSVSFGFIRFKSKDQNSKLTKHLKPDL